MVLTEGLAHGCVACAYDAYETIYDIMRVMVLYHHPNQLLWQERKMKL